MTRYEYAEFTIGSSEVDANGELLDDAETVFKWRTADGSSGDNDSLRAVCKDIGIREPSKRNLVSIVNGLSEKGWELVDCSFLSYGIVCLGPNLSDIGDYPFSMYIHCWFRRPVKAGRPYTAIGPS